MTAPSRLLTTAAAIAAATCIAVFGPRLGPIAAMENDLADLRVAVLNPAAPPHPDIVIASISESTFAHLGQRTPVDRAFLADTIRALDAAGARAIGVDIFLGESTDEDADRQLTAALNAVTVPTILAWADSKAAPGAIAPWQDQLWTAFRSQITNPLVTDGLGLLLRDQRDQIVRDAFIARPSPDMPLQLGFAPAIAAAVGHELSMPPDTAPEPVALDYYGLPRANQPVFLQLPAESLNPAIPVLWERIQPLIDGKIVLVGLDVPTLDRHPTPFGLLPDLRDGMPGVVIHAHALAQILDGRQAPAQPAWLSLLLAGLAAMAGALAARVTGNSWLKGLLLLLGPMAIAAAGFGLFAASHVMIHILAPSLGYLTAFILTGFGMDAYHRREIRLLGGAFARYVSPAVISQLRRDPSRLRLGGEERVITVLLTDLTGSVALGERLQADRFVVLLNGYLDGISRIVLAHDGTIDKFIGDAVMALFGAPLNQPDHAERAVRCALAIDTFTKQYSADLHSQGVPFGGTRIGVHTDAAIIGNFGGEQRFDYTAIGRVTNLCARLEAANKQLGTTICVSQATVDACPGLAFRPIGVIGLRGVSEPITVYSPDGFPGNVDQATYLQAYRLLDADPKSAMTAFADLAQTHPADPLVRLHCARLRSGDTGVTIGTA